MTARMLAKPTPSHAVRSQGLVTAPHGDDPWGLLELLHELLDHEDGGLAELTYYSDGDHGALLYPNCAQSPSAFRRLFDARLIAPAGASVLCALITYVPAERHAVRLRSGGSVSIFFKIDIPISGIIRLCGSIGLTALDPGAVELSELLSQAPCGVAVEARPHGEVRLRLYWMATSEPTAADRVALLGSRRLGLHPSHCAGLVAAWQRLTSRPDRIVINLSSDANAALALKLELPEVEASKAAELAGTSPGARQALRSALAAATALGWNGRFPYLGIRWQGAAPPALTFYVDARPLTRALAGKVVSQ